MPEEMERFVGRVVEIRDPRWHKPQLVRIVDVEVSDFTGHTDGGADLQIWYWAKYA